MRTYKFEDLTGQKFGRFTVLGERQVVKTPGGWPIATWSCRCDCGEIRRVQVSNLKCGTQKSCGCLHSDMMREKNSKPAGVAATNQVWRYYTANARRRGLEWTLDRAAFEELIFGPCAYCGAVESMESARARDRKRHNGIDRIDSTRGYVTGNCATACRTCNNAKASMSYEEFRDWARRVFNRLWAAGS